MRRASTSGAALRYVATRRIELREEGELKIHTEQVVRDGRRVRIQFAPGSRFEGQVVIESAEGRFIVDRTRREIRRLPSRGDESERRLGRFVQMVETGVFTLGSSDGGKIAGFPTRRLVLSREGRPFVALSIEPKSAAVLRRESFGPTESEGPAGSYAFTKFQIRSKIAPTNFVLPKSGFKLVSPLDDLRALATKEGIPIRLLPTATGYRLEGSRTRETRAGTILASFYSGGGKRLTLFATEGDLPELPARRNGSVSGPVGVSLFRWRVGTTSYGLLGEETPARLKALAGALTSG